jgi:hypothetical protein
MTRINVLGGYMDNELDFNDDYLDNAKETRLNRKKRKAKKPQSLEDLIKDQLIKNIERRNFDLVFEEEESEK